MKTFFIIMVILTQMGVTEFARAEDVACSIENDLIEVEMKHLQYDKNDKPYYDLVFRPFPEEWSLAFPGLGKMRVKSSPKFSSAEEIRLEYFSLKGELLTTKELKISSSPKENAAYLATQGDLDVEFIKFFEKAKEGKVRVSIVAKKKTICTFSVKILGILEQTD